MTMECGVGITWYEMFELSPLSREPDSWFDFDLGGEG